MGTGSFPRLKRPGRGVDHPLPSNAEVKERVELLPLWAFMACYRETFTFTLSPRVRRANGQTEFMTGYSVTCHNVTAASAQNVQPTLQTVNTWPLNKSVHTCVPADCYCISSQFKHCSIC